MSKRYNIKWNESDEKELKKAVRNYNDKIRRLEKKDPSNKGALPEKVSIAEMKELVTTRRDLQREINSLRRFSKRGAEKIVDVPDNEYNLKITKWQKEEINRRVGVINRKRKLQREKIENLEVTSRGEKQGYKIGDVGMGKTQMNELKEIQAFNRTMNRKDLKMKYKHLLKESQGKYWNETEQRLKDNYIKSLEDNFNPADIVDIKNNIDKMDFKNFYDVYMAEGGNMELSYPGDNEEYQKNLNALNTLWNSK